MGLFKSSRNDSNQDLDGKQDGGLDSEEQAQTDFDQDMANLDEDEKAALDSLFDDDSDSQLEDDAENGSTVPDDSGCADEADDPETQDDLDEGDSADADAEAEDGFSDDDDSAAEDAGTEDDAVTEDGDESDGADTGDAADTPETPDDLDDVDSPTEVITDSYTVAATSVGFGDEDSALDADDTLIDYEEEPESSFEDDETTMIPVSTYVGKHGRKPEADGTGAADGGAGSSVPGADGASKSGGSSKKRAAVIAICAVIGVLAVAYIGISVFFMSHFGFGTTISGIDCSFKTVAEVESLLQDAQDSYVLTIYERTDEEALEVSSDGTAASSESTDEETEAATDSSDSDETADETDSSSETGSSESDYVMDTASYSETYAANVANNTGVTGSQTETITGTDVGLYYDSSTGQVEAFLEAQNAWAWPARFFGSYDDSPIVFGYDEDMLQSVFETLACMDNSDSVEPVDAYVEFDETSYIVMSEVPGNTVDTDAAKVFIVEAITNAQEELDLSATGCYLAPDVISTDEELVEYAAMLDEYVPFALTYVFSDGTEEVLDGTTVFEWLTISDDGSYTVDEDAVEAWVSDFADRYNTVGDERTFTSVDGNTYTVSGGTYGWQVNESAEVEAIVAMLETKESESRSPYWSVEAAENVEEGEADWGDTYIELNMAEQHLYYVEDGEIVLECDVVTGTKGSHDTPTGVYYILEMSTDRTLRGDQLEDGSYEYESFVYYWMRITWSGIGFHDATWRSSFGGTIYTYSGSHGCINMPLDYAAQLYELVEIGTPAIIHY